MRLRAHAARADGGWFAGEDFQLGVHSFGLAGDDVGINSSQILLLKGADGNWAGKGGDGS